MDMTIREALADGIQSEASVEQYVNGIEFIWKIMMLSRGRNAHRIYMVKNKSEQSCRLRVRTI
jgi:hypothetical protein